jgi:hypothetical protein
MELVICVGSGVAASRASFTVVFYLTRKSADISVVTDVHRISAIGQHVNLEGVTEASGFERRVPPGKPQFIN